MMGRAVCFETGGEIEGKMLWMGGTMCSLSSHEEIFNTFSTTTDP
jgi:hypothetical protein